MVHLGKSEAVTHKQAALMKSKSHYPLAGSDFITHILTYKLAHKHRHLCAYYEELDVNESAE